VRKGKELQRRLATAEAAQAPQVDTQSEREIDSTTADAAVQQLRQEHAQLAQRLQQAESERDTLQQRQQQALSDLQQELQDERQHSHDVEAQNEAAQRAANDLRVAAAEADTRLKQQQRQSEAALLQAQEKADALQRQLQQLQDREPAGEVVAPDSAGNETEHVITALKSRVADLEASLARAQAQQHDVQQQQQQKLDPDAAKAVQRAAAAEATAAAMRSEVDMMREALQTAAGQVQAIAMLFDRVDSSICVTQQCVQQTTTTLVVLGNDAVVHTPKVLGCRWLVVYMHPTWAFAHVQVQRAHAAEAAESAAAAGAQAEAAEARRSLAVAQGALAGAEGLEAELAAVRERAREQQQQREVPAGLTGSGCPCG
jgi:hypothetical protein